MERNKIYLIPFDWKSFAGNHTAMASYLAYKLKNDIYGIEVIPMYGPNNNSSYLPRTKAYPQYNTNCSLSTLVFDVQYSSAQDNTTSRLIKYSNLED